MEPPKDFKLCFLGDNNLGSYQNDYNINEDPYQLIHQQLNTCSLIIANLENNIATPGTGTKQAKGYNFIVPPEKIKFLVDAGIKVVSLANNHTMDYGPAALIDQMKHLKEYGVQYFGAGENLAAAFTPTFIDAAGVKIAFIGANATENNVTIPRGNNAGSAYFNAALLADEITKAKQGADLVVAFTHWGLENSTVIQQFEKTWAKFFIDHGVDLVVGAGPHVRQGAEVYKGKYIFYSLGNFAAAGFSGVPEGTIGRVMETVLSNKTFTKFSTYDVDIIYQGFPKVRPGSEQNY
jgi:poly-gamma-glutamate synthesis protein (capsule biosynthesis protein)